MAFTTWNPSDKGSGIALSGGNLIAQAISGTFHGVRSVASQTTGKWYWEITLAGYTAAEAVGVANASAVLTGGSALSSTNDSLVMLGNGNIVKNNIVVATGPGYGGVNDVVGVAIDFTAGTVAFNRNGGAFTSTTSIPIGALFAAVGSGSTLSTVYTANFGTTAFVYTPPSGHTGLIENLNYQFAMQGNLGVGGNSAILINPLTIAMLGGVSMGGATEVASVSQFTMTGGVSMGGNAAMEFATGARYNLSEDGVPSGGVVLGGEALVRDLLAEAGAGGVVLGGEAVVLERLPFVPTGGVVLAGSATLAFIVVPLPDGGVVLAGTATVLSKYVLPADGGVALGGSATVSDYSAWFMPSGGVTLAGDAIAYFVPSYLTATTENPRAYPYPGWAVNVETKAASRYMSLPANSFARFKGRSFVSNAGGIYEIGAEDDAGQPIKASIEFPTTDFATSYEKRMEAAYFGMSSGGKVRIKVKVKGKAPQYYLIQPTPANADQRGTRVPIGKGLVGRYWGFRIDNVAGGDFTLATAEFNPARGTRHGA